jgi:hypothetical protein
MTKKEIFEPF